MMWLLQSLVAWFLTAQGLNLTFALVCLWAACGLHPRWVALLSAALYILLAFA